MRAAIVLLACFALIGCKPESRETVSDPSLITYSRDARTGLCFATLGRYSVSTNGSGSESFSISNVPCTPAVMALLPANQR